MRDTSSFLNEHEDPQGKPDSTIDEQEGKIDVFSEPLEIQIANRADAISQRRGGHGAQSLASWLEAAREVLSEDS
jgi:hypothetical protein